MLSTETPTVCSALRTVEASAPVVGMNMRYRTCGACGSTTECSPANRVLSTSFGTWDDIAACADGRWLCSDCSWAYKEPRLRRGALVVTTAPSATRPTPSQLRTVLSAPIAADTTVIVPVGGKRSLVPTARWGRITFDGGTIPWSSRHAHLMHTATRLREYGAHERSLTLPSPPSAVIDSLPVEQHSTVRRLWRDFDPARDDAALLPLMCRLSRKDKA